MSTQKKHHPLKNPITLKVLIIAVMTLLLLIPLSMIKGIVKERSQLRNNAVKETSKQWAGSQKISGPILTIPYTARVSTQNKGFKTKYIHILPEELHIDGTLDSKSLKRSIYEVIVYNSELNNTGNFVIPNLENTIKPLQIQWKEAFITYEIQDLRGVSETLILSIADKKIKPTSGVHYSLNNLFSNGVTFPIDLEKIEQQKLLNFSLPMKLRGSQQFLFIPLGKTTKINLSSNWDSPSFNGEFIPKKRSVTSNGFTANWEILELNRGFSQVWIDRKPTEEILNSEFGVSLKVPVDDYQKTIRSIKYGILTIGLTFLAFFLVEILTDIKTHPFQMGLIGGGLCLFYLLLLSIAEHSNFNTAYFIASGIILLITTGYSLFVFKGRRSYSIILFVVISAIYTFIFVTLQLTDYALLIGTIGLVITLVLTMFFTRNIKWYESLE